MIQRINHLDLEQKIELKQMMSREEIMMMIIIMKIIIIKSTLKNNDKVNLSDYSDAYIPVKGNITVPNTEAAGVAVNNTDKKVVLEYWAPFTSRITEINNTQVDHAEDVDLVMPVYNLIEYSNADSKTFGGLWQYYRDEQVIDANVNIVDFPANDNYSN